MGGTVVPVPGRKFSRRAWLAIAAIPAVALLVPLILWLRCGLGGCPNADRLRSYQPGKASQLLDRSGKVFAELRPVEADTAPLKSIPKHVREAFVAVEDQRFESHGGVDWRRVGGAMLANVRAGGVEQGFSTITMQLARNVFPDRLPAKQRTLTRKLMEVRVAYAIEGRFTKDEILELYLSHIYFGNGARGIEAAARHYFGQSASRLSVAQGALLAALPKGPTTYDPRRHPDRARERRDLVLTLMEQQGRLTAPQAKAARAASLGIVRRRPARATEMGLAPYFVEEVRRRLEDEIGERLYDESLRVTTTLDVPMQRAAEDELLRQLASMGSAGGQPLQGAVVAIEAATGDVLAWVGGRDFEQSRFDRVGNSRRQPGSAFKPFVYAAALSEGHVLSERLADAPTSVRLASNRTWEPKNFDGRYDGVVTLRDALVRSKNVPTVGLAADVGLDEVVELAKDAGITAEMDETPAMPLGTMALSPLELAAAYIPFATLGEAVRPRLFTGVRAEDGDEVWTADKPEPRRVLDAGVAYLITHVLQEAVERGTGTAVRAAGFQGPVAGKTGTTNDATDAWFVGYTPQLVAATWIGYDEPETIGEGATGGHVAAPLWGRIMARLGTRGGAGWTRPEEVVERWVDVATGAMLDEGCRPSHGRAYRELFLRGALPDEVCPDRGDVVVADTGGPAGGEEDPFGIWPEDIDPGSEAAPPPEYEEAERVRGKRWGKAAKREGPRDDGRRAEMRRGGGDDDGRGRGREKNKGRGKGRGRGKRGKD